MGQITTLKRNKPDSEQTWTGKLFIWSGYTLVALFTLFCFIPFWMVIINSFTAEKEIMTKGFQLFPSEFSLEAYRVLFRSGQIYSSYAVTIFVTIVGTVLAMAITSTYAYVLAHRRVKYRNFLSFMTYLTMIFGAGLVGFYITIANYLDLKDSIWALILPYLLNPFFAFILVAFYRTVPYELNEAATVDGASEFKIFFKIIFPISMPAISTVGLFYSLTYWNDYWLALLFIDDYKLHPLQIMLRQLISNANMKQYIAGANMDYAQAIPTYGLQMATVCLTIGPIILLYPYVQKFFVKGITIGAVKG
jgi:putative aldouronate transport system permease protein